LILKIFLRVIQKGFNWGMAHPHASQTQNIFSLTVIECAALYLQKLSISVSVKTERDR
jgi:hypothetical protein